MTETHTPLDLLFRILERRSTYMEGVRGPITYIDDGLVSKAEAEVAELRAEVKRLREERM